MMGPWWGAMTARRSSSAAPAPLEAYAREFDELFEVLAQRDGCRAYLQGLLLPRDRNKTLTGLVGTEPVGVRKPPSRNGINSSFQNRSGRPRR